MEKSQAYIIATAIVVASLIVAAAVIVAPTPGRYVSLGGAARVVLDTHSGEVWRVDQREGERRVVIRNP